MNKNNYVIILAGGIGSRFWPVSKTNFPKQFLDILNSGRTLLQSTYDRFQNFIPAENIFVITSDSYTEIIKEQLSSLPNENIVGEPERKNTAPCIAYMALKLKKMNPQANLIIAPSDHLIKDQKKFEANCLNALEITSRHDIFVTLGIIPTSANTGYGYIQHENSDHGPSIRKVKRFTEKPNKETASKFLKHGSYLWNSGIFIWKAEDILNAFEQFSGEIFSLFIRALPDINTRHEKSRIKNIYSCCKSISIDYAILEKAKNIFVIPADFEWSDLGTWNSAWQNCAKDQSQNAVTGENTLMIASKNCIVHSNGGKLVLLGGVQDLIVVNTPDSLMICNKENEQNIKEYIEEVRRTKGVTYL
jgi:mannose-1-phosphate guanylyltransferase